MRTLIVTEDSETVAENEDLDALDYFRGNFRPVYKLATELSEYTDVFSLIISAKYGLVQGSESISSQKKTERQEIARNIISEIEKSQVVVILLTVDNFQSIVLDNREEIINAANEGSLWCVGVSRKMHEKFPTASLEDKNCDLIKYNRRGVARIDTKTRNELIERVRQQI